QPFGLHRLFGASLVPLSPAHSGGHRHHRGGILCKPEGQPIWLPPPGGRGRLYRRNALCEKNRHLPRLRQGYPHLRPKAVAHGGLAEEFPALRELSPPPGKALLSHQSGGCSSVSSKERHFLCVSSPPHADGGAERLHVLTLFHRSQRPYPVDHRHP